MPPRLIGAVLLLMGGFGVVPATAQEAVRAVAELSSSACFPLARGTLKIPATFTGDDVERTLKPLGLGVGITTAMQKDMGSIGLSLISRAGLASRSAADGELVMAYDGPQPGCRILLLSDSVADLSEAVATGLVAGGWRAVPALTTVRAGLQRRVFLRRDTSGNPYMLNLMTLPGGSARLRLTTTVVRVPPNVTLPEGY